MDKRTRTTLARAVRILGVVLALALTAAGMILPFLGREFAFFYFLYATFAAQAGSFLAMLIEEGLAGLRLLRNPAPRNLR
jgi:multisubunit Na+/H+ antiporter MnhB subunit